MFLSALFDEECMKVSVMHELSEDQIQRGTFKKLTLVTPWNLQDHAAEYIAACGGFSNGDFKFRSDLFTFECSDETYNKWEAILKERREFEIFIHHLATQNVKEIYLPEAERSEIFEKNVCYLSEDISEMLTKNMKENDLTLHESTHLVYEQLKADHSELYEDFKKKIIVS